MMVVYALILIISIITLILIFWDYLIKSNYNGFRRFFNILLISLCMILSIYLFYTENILGGFAWAFNSLFFTYRFRSLNASRKKASEIMSCLDSLIKKIKR